MRTEQEIVTALSEKFDFLQDNIKIQRQKRIFTKFLIKEEFEQVLHFLHDEMGFIKAHHVVGTDEGDDLGFIYLLSNEDNIILALKEKAPKSDPKINSMTDIYPSLLLHERELVDLFGAVISGLPEGLSYPLPDGWPKGSYPLRKDWDPKYFDKETMTYNPPAETGDIKK
jgi:Ni,Fe-hydrogenase III component G